MLEDFVGSWIIVDKVMHPKHVNGSERFFLGVFDSDLLESVNVLGISFNDSNRTT